MIQWDEKLNKQFRSALFIAGALYIAGPIAYLMIAQFITVPSPAGGEIQFVMYILLILGLIQPAVLKVIESFQVSMFKKVYDKNEVEKIESSPKSFKAIIAAPGLDKARTGTPMGLFTIMTIIKAAVVEAIYLYGFVVFFLSGEITNMLYFYPIGILWTFVYFPRKSQYETLVEKLEQYGT